MATPQSNLGALLGGGQQQSSDPTNDNGGGDTLSSQVQALQVQAMMIARSNLANPAVADAMRQIIQLSQAALQQAASAQSSGGGQQQQSAPAGPGGAGY